MMKSKPARFIWADLVRTTAIVLVVSAHTLRVSFSNSLGDNFWLLLFIIARAGVPLFLMLSGALLLPKKDSILLFFNKRLKRILLPWLFWTIIYFLLTGAKMSLREIFSSKFTYLPMIFCLYLLIPLFRVIVQKGQRYLTWYFIALWFLGTSLLPYLRNSLAFPLRVDNGLVRQTVSNSGFLVFGYLLTKLSLKKKGKQLAAGLLILGLALMFYLVKRIGRVDFDLFNFNFPITIIFSAGLFLALKNLSEKIKLKSLANSWLISLSQASFGVFLIHSLLIEKLGQLSNFPLILVLSFFIIVVLAKSSRLRPFVT